MIWTKSFFGKSLCMVVLATLLLQLSGCGTILYPERRGQRGGSIDAGIAVLDGIGLLFFLIPGVIAFAVDFSTGAIYLPGGHRSSLPAEGIKVVGVNPTELRNIDTLKEIVVRETGISKAVDLNRAEVSPLARLEDIPAKIAGLEKSGYQLQ
jgi:hypothetical protein